MEGSGTYFMIVFRFTDSVTVCSRIGVNSESQVFARWRHCALPCGHIGATWRIPLNFASFGPPESTTQTAIRSVQPFLHSARQKVPTLYKHSCVLSKTGLSGALTETGICTSLKSDFYFWFHSPLNGKLALLNFICTWDLVLICSRKLPKSESAHV